MLAIFPHIISVGVLLLSSVLGVPLEPRQFENTGDGANAGLFTAASSSSAASPTVTDASTATTDTPAIAEGQLFAQTTMPAGSATTGGAQSSGGATGTGECPKTSSAPRCYRMHSDFPAESQWMDLPCMISHARPDMVGISNDGPDEADNVISAIQSVSEQAGIDPRIPFAVMLQESSGKVRPIIGDWGKSFGLFQVQIPGVALCDGYAKNTCPMSVITAMVENGIYGHNGTDTPPKAPGIAYWLSAESGDVAYAMRGYNTGRIPNREDLTDATATKSYVSDIGNRLVGGLLGAAHRATCP
ncbi:MAG: hypothetical protein Q9216_003283 [Gyalolechia sp. 2 TL-2023]